MARNRDLLDDFRSNERGPGFGGSGRHGDSPGISVREGKLIARGGGGSRETVQEPKKIPMKRKYL